MKSIAPLCGPEFTSSPLLCSIRSWQRSESPISPRWRMGLGKNGAAICIFLNQVSKVHGVWGFSMPGWSVKSSAPRHFSHSTSPAEHWAYRVVPSLVLWRKTELIPWYAWRSSCFQNNQGSTSSIQGTVSVPQPQHCMVSCKPFCLLQWLKCQGEASQPHTPHSSNAPTIILTTLDTRWGGKAYIYIKHGSCPAYFDGISCHTNT